jgi:hypothetical protein
MAYDSNQPKRIQSPEESLHWISFNLKKISEELKRIGDLLFANAPGMPSPPPKQYERPQYQPPAQSSYQTPPPRVYKEDRAEELPF